MLLRRNKTLLRLYSTLETLTKTLTKALTKTLINRFANFRVLETLRVDLSDLLCSVESRRGILQLIFAYPIGSLWLVSSRLNAAINGVWGYFLFKVWHVPNMCRTILTRIAEQAPRPKMLARNAVHLVYRSIWHPTVWGVQKGFSSNVPLLWGLTGCPRFGFWSGTLSCGQSVAWHIYIYIYLFRRTQFQDQAGKSMVTLKFLPHW